MFHVSSLVVHSLAFLHEYFLFFTCLSYHTTRTPSTSRTPPSSLGRQVAPSRITLASRPAEWLKPATTPTGYEPKELGTVSRIEAYSGDPYQSYDVQEKVGKKIAELLSQKKWRKIERLEQLACRILKYQRRPTSNRRCISKRLLNNWIWRTVHHGHDEFSVQKLR